MTTFGSDLLIGAGFLALAIFAVVVTIPRQGGPRWREIATKRETWMSVGVVLVAEFVLRLLPEWLRRIFSIPPWQGTLVATAFLVLGAAAFAIVRERVESRRGR